MGSIILLQALPNLPSLVLCNSDKEAIPELNTNCAGNKTGNQSSVSGLTSHNNCQKDKQTIIEFWENKTN